MTVYPFQISEVIHTYDKVSKISQSTASDAKERGEPEDIVTISSEAKKRHISGQNNNDASLKNRKIRR
ncbi:MAG: hypothetical protein HY756_04380 [Nitrospirae bacterium]|nr:hypothetical protein [Nitrospirota bacterium]